MNLIRLQELTSLRAVEPVRPQLDESKLMADFDKIRDTVEVAIKDLVVEIGKNGDLHQLMKTSGADKIDTAKDGDKQTVLSRIFVRVEQFKKEIEQLMLEAEIMLASTVNEEHIVEGSCDDNVGWYCVNPKTNEVFGPLKSQDEAKKKCHPGNEVAFGCPSDEKDKHFIKMKAPKVEESLSTLRSMQALTEGKDYDDSSDFTDEFYGILQKVEEMRGKMKNPRWMGWLEATDENFGTECVQSGRGAIAAIDSLKANLHDLDQELDNAA